MAVTLNWRVDRIRPNEVVLTREDPTAPNRPPLTRIIPLHTEDEDATPTPRPQTPAPAPAPAPAPPPR